jgi:serine protease Do
VTAQEVSPAIAKAIGLNEPAGALVSDVRPDSPAQKAGVQTGDVILAVNGNRIEESNQLRMTVSMMSPDQTVNLKIFRAGKTTDVPVRIAEMPGEKVEKASNDSKDGGKNALQGVAVEDLDAQTARQLGLPARAQGAVVTDIDPASQAAASGLREGDVIQQVDHQPVANADDFNRAMQHSNGGSLLLVNRGGNKLFLAV